MSDNPSKYNTFCVTNVLVVKKLLACLESNLKTDRGFETADSGPSQKMF